MASNLLNYYAALATTNIVARSKNIPVRYGSNLQTSVSHADLPVRLLLPVGSRADGKNIQALDIGSAFRTATWRITDLLLLALVSEGRGLEDFAEDLVRYVVDYEAAMNARRQPVSGCTLENLAIETGVYEWPLGSKVWYFGASAVHGVKELIQ